MRWVVALIFLIPVVFASPELLFSDFTSGPNIGNTDGAGGLTAAQHGAIVTVWGTNLGTSQGTSEIYLKDSTQTLRAAAHVYYWGNADPDNVGSGPADLYRFQNMQEIAFSIPANATDGAGNILTLVDGSYSNMLNFTIREGNIYFVKATGDDTTGNGSFSNPWLTLDYNTGAAGKVYAGDMIYSFTGVSEDSEFGYRYNTHGGNITHPVSYAAYPGERVTVSQITFWSSAPYPEYINFAKFIINTTSRGIGGIKGMRAVGNAITGPNAEGQSGAISGSADGTSGVKAYGNYIYDFGLNNYSIRLHHVFYLTNRDGTPNEAYEVAWNMLLNNHARGGLHNYDEGVCGDFTGTIRVHDNFVINQSGAGFDFQGSGDGYDGSGCYEVPVEVYNNILVNCGQPPFNDPAFSITMSGTRSHIKVYNNIIYGWSTPEYDNVAVYIQDNGSSSWNFNGSYDFFNNIVVDTKNLSFYDSQYWKTANSTGNNIWYNGGDGDPLDYPVWDSGYLTIDPLFIDPDNYDFSLSAESPACGTGNETYGDDIGAIPCTVATGSPILFFSDLVNGPKDTGKDDNGAFVTIWGNRLGDTQGTSTVTIGGGEAVDYLVWSDDKISFQLGPEAQNGSIVVHTSNGDSNGLPFTINNGTVFFATNLDEAPDTGSGTYADPFNHAQSFYDQITPGDLLYLREGVYTGHYGKEFMGGSYQIMTGKPGSADAYVAWIAYPGENVTFVWDDGRQFMFKDSDTQNLAHYQVVSQITLDGNGTGSPGGIGTGGWYLSNENGAGHIRIIGCRITNAAKGGSTTMTGHVRLTADGSRLLGTEIDNCGIKGNAFNNNHLVYIQCGSDDIEIAYNHFHDNAAGHCIQMHSDNGLYGNGSTLYSNYSYNNIRIHSNLITADNPGDMRGPTMSNIAKNSTAYYYNNVVKDLGWFSAFNLNNGIAYIYSNTFINIGGGGVVSLYGDSGQFMYLKNNIMWSDGNEPYVYFGTYSTDYSNWSNVEIDSNLYYNYGAAPSQDVNAVEGDPLMIDVSGEDFSLNSSSPAVDAGTSDVSGVVTIDYDGVPRPVDGDNNGSEEYDIGAYEYVLLAPSVEQYHDADSNEDGNISTTEIRDYIGLWRLGTTTIDEVIDALVIWKE